MVNKNDLKQIIDYLEKSVLVCKSVCIPISLNILLFINSSVE